MKIISVLEASGFDPIRLAEVDADAAYALELQRQEYSRENFMPNRHQYHPFRVESDDESGDTNPSVSMEPDIPQFSNDEELAAYLQERENRNQRRYRPPPLPPFLLRPRPNPTSTTQTSESTESENTLIPPFRNTQRPPVHNEDDDDDDDNPYFSPQAFFQFLANQGHTLPEGFGQFMTNYRRRYRRTGDLQDTEEDFGPEDYERLLQLDESIHKKKLTKEQINSIPEIKFHRQSNNNDEENKCGVCLEFF